MLNSQRAGDQELAVARKHRETLAIEVKAASQCITEGEALVQSLRTEAQLAAFRLQEAD